MKRNYIRTTLFYATITLLLCLISCSQPEKEKFFLIKGRVQNYDESQVELKSSGINHKTTVQDGQFEFKIPTKGQPNIYKLAFKETDVPVFLLPGESLNVSFDFKNMESTIQYLGKTQMESTYLWEVAQVDDYATMSHRIMTDSLSVFLERHNNYFNKKEDKLDSLNQLNPSIPQYFYELAKAELLFKKAEEKMYFAMTKLNEDKPDILGDNYFSFLDDLDYNRQDYIQLFNFSQSLSAFISLKSPNHFGSSTNEIFETIKENLRDSQVMELAYFNQLNMAINYMGIDEGVKEELQYFRGISQNRVYNEALTKGYDKWKPLAQGNKAPEILAFDTSGKEVLIGNFKGKIIYIDVWATWCAPCKKEMPYLAGIKNKYKDNPNIEIIGISIDKEVDLWKSFLGKEGLSGTQLIAENAFESQFIKDYLIGGIPRFILIDTDGIIVSANAPRPSQTEELTKLIDGLITDPTI